MEIKTETSFKKNTKCADVYTESQADYSLPDYLCDVRKILFTDAALRPSGKFSGGDEIEFSGVVVYSVVYLDSENKLSSAEFTSDYDYSVKYSGEDYLDSVSDTRVSNYSIRLVGPRRISARSSLVGSVQISENASISVSGSAFDGEGAPEISTKSVKIRSNSLSSVLEREYAEEIASLEGAIADEVSVIYSSAEASVDSMEKNDEAVNVKGKLRMLSVIRNGDEPAYRVEKTVGFEETVGFDGLRSDMRLSPRLTVTSLKSNVNPTESGCEVVVSGIVEFCILGEGNDEASLVLDGYLKSCPTENSYSDFSFTELVDCETVKGSHNAEVDRSDIESDSLHEIIFLTATPKVERIDKEEGRVNLIGEVRYSGVASEIIDGELSYVSLKFSSPFVANVNIDCQNDDKTQVEARVLAYNASATLDANRLYATCTLESCVAVCEAKSEKILTTMAKSDGAEYSSVAGITVYYPTESDTLFSVAKRFHTSSLKVARDNDISESVFASDNPEGKLVGIKKLLIY
ncbi:MAG: DUF3794 domain-containing protein [Clostridia bacterium]|nr:DUF3794 domain-containing protein [Clostridia bacterium]